jgi:hypothetical protein
VGNRNETGDFTEVREPGPSEVEVRFYVKKILGGNTLGSSDILRKLLAFYAERSLQGAEPPKEHEIATLGLGRPMNFDPRVDSTVRVQTGRLRSKLAEYYVGEGANDTVVLGISKGSYHLEWHYRTAPAPNPSPVKPTVVRPRPRWPTIAALALLLVFLGVLAYPSRAPQASRQETALRLFWHDFLRAPNSPLVVFSNPRFVGAAGQSLRYYHEGVDSSDVIDDTYTGTGEVMAVHELTRTFASFGKDLRVKRAQLLTWDDAKQSNLILIGSPEQNLPMAERPWLQEFRFKPYDKGPRAGEVGILNLHPRSGEEPYYFGSPTRPIRYDYGVIGLVRGAAPDRRAVVLAGNSTLGTQAAAEFACNGNALAEILNRLELSGSAPLPEFEALLYVQVNGGVPVETRLMLVHRNSNPVAR